MIEKFQLKIHKNAEFLETKKYDLVQRILKYQLRQN